MKHKIIGLTGGIGSGKTTVAGIIEREGYPVFYADPQAQYIINNNKEVREQLTLHFGQEAYKEGVFNRPYIAEIVFNDTHKLELLNRIVHPAVLNAFKKWCTEQITDMVFLESAILFESGWDNHFDAIINVEAPLELRIQRVVERDGITENQVRARIANQLPDEERMKRAHFRINTSSQIPVIQQTIKILEELKRR
ncbi:MAG: dephospho-CoA kinase [Marinifilaceae bacterium]